MNYLLQLNQPTETKSPLRVSSLSDGSLTDKTTESTNRTKHTDTASMYGGGQPCDQRLRECACCYTMLPDEAFSKTQQKKGSRAKCRD